VIPCVWLLLAVVACMIWAPEFVWLPVVMSLTFLTVMLLTRHSRPKPAHDTTTK